MQNSRAGRATKPTATQRFHPDNQRLRRTRIKKMTIQEIEFWMAHGIMFSAVLQREDILYKAWTGGRAHPRMHMNSMRAWVNKTMLTLEQVRNSKARVAMIGLHTTGDDHAERQD